MPVFAVRTMDNTPLVKHTRNVTIKIDYRNAITKQKNQQEREKTTTTTTNRQTKSNKLITHLRLAHPYAKY